MRVDIRSHGNNAYLGVSSSSDMLIDTWLKWYKVKLADSVEFKSLPSGLHNVEEDLV